MITIVLPDGYEYEITDADQPRDLELEIDALGIDNALAGLPGMLKLTVDAENVNRTARALDHLRNAGKAGPEIHAARDVVLTRLAISPLTYRLRSWEFDGQDLTFWSYTGQYNQGDRIVVGDKELRVVSVAEQASPSTDGVLVVENWSFRH